MRSFTLLVAVALALHATLAADDACPARVEQIGGAALEWIVGPQEDVGELQQWCQGVGPPVVVASPASVSTPPALGDLVVVTWNAHLAEGRLTELIQALRRGDLTSGEPVARFVLLVQELFRRGPAVPAFQSRARSAHAIRARDPDAPDVNGYAATLGLAIAYVPAMRNGIDLLEDRGNAVISTEPLSNVVAVELPFERQRRVAVGATLDVLQDGRRQTLRVMNVHFESLASPKSLWVFRNPRRRQTMEILTVLSSPEWNAGGRSAGTVLGGDFNTIKGGSDESTYRRARQWSVSLATEDRRATHLMGRLDYVFFRLAPGWRGASWRVDDTFGSDHHPVVGRFESTQ